MVDLFFHELLPFFKNRFPDFSRLCFHISEWKLVGSFCMKTYKSSSTLVTVDLLFHELLSFVQNSFSGLFSALLSYIWMKVGSKLPYEELHIKFDFGHDWPTFSWVIALCSKFVFRTILGYAFTYLTPVKPEGTIGLHSVRQSVSPSVCLSVTLVFRTFLNYAFTYLNESW